MNQTRRKLLAILAALLTFISVGVITTLLYRHILGAEMTKRVIHAHFVAGHPEEAEVKIKRKGKKTNLLPSDLILAAGCIAAIFVPLVVYFRIRHPIQEEELVIKENQSKRKKPPAQASKKKRA